MHKKNILITGASRGIGKAIALRFAKEQHNIIITCNNNIDLLHDVEKEITDAGASCLTYQGDLSDSKNVSTLASLAKKTFGPIDILINNAGISYVGLLTDMTDDDWNKVIATNLNSVFYCCREFAPDMIHNHSGRIINISSVWGSNGASCEVAYSASKGAINSFTRAFAKELAPSGIAVNAISCGLIDTDMNKCFEQEDLDAICDEIPCGRMGTTSEVADLVYSISTQSDYLTGQIITIDGGWM